MSYLWFEVPKVRSEISKISGLSVQSVVDTGPNDETNVLIILEIANKGRLIAFNPTAKDIAEDKPIPIVGVGDCFGQLSELIPLQQAIQEYDQLHRRAKELAYAKGCGRP